MQFTYQIQIPINDMAKTVAKKKKAEKKSASKKLAKKPVPKKKTVTKKKTVPKAPEEDYSDLFAKIVDLEERIEKLEK